MPLIQNLIQRSASIIDEYIEGNSSLNPLQILEARQLPLRIQP